MVQASTPIEILGAEAIEPIPPPAIDIASAIGLRSTKLPGGIDALFSKSTFLGIVNKMLGESYAEINRENAEAARELLNIIYASARLKLNQGGDPMPSAKSGPLDATQIGESGPDSDHCVQSGTKYQSLFGRHFLLNPTRQPWWFTNCND